MATKLKEVDAVIVGLGWTGGILAAELIKAGLKVVALERGADRTTTADYTVPRVRDELRFVHRHDLMQNTSRDTITVRNTGDVTAQLVARRWLVSDALGNVEEVRGLAVVGHQPVLKPGESFEYTSWTRLPTPQGSMEGTFFCMTEDAHSFETPVPTFALVRSQALH